MSSAQRSDVLVRAGSNVAAGNAGTTIPAGFWRRYLAYSIDYLLLAPILFVLLAPAVGSAYTEILAVNQLLQDWVWAHMLAQQSALPSPWLLSQALMQDASLQASLQAGMSRINLALLSAVALGAGLAGIYFIGFEASRWQATPGKRLLDIRVLDLHGRRLGWPRAGARFLAGSLSWLSCNLGHAIAGWRADGRALHDLIAGTQVVADSPMPRWARWLLMAQLLLLFGLLLGLSARLLWQLLELAQLASDASL